jgi:hypothetical protein
MVSPGIHSETKVNTFFCQTEILRQEEIRRHLTAERNAKIHEARLAAAEETDRSGRIASALSLRWRRLRAERGIPATPLRLPSTAGKPLDRG